MKVSLRRIRLTKKDIQSYLAIQRAINSEFTLITESEEEAYQDIGTSTAYFILVDGEKAGAISYETRVATGLMSTYAYICEVSVKPAFEGRSVARRAMQMILKESSWVDFHQLMVHPRHKKAIILYLTLDFEIQELIPDHFGDGEPRMRMIRRQKKE